MAVTVTLEVLLIIKQNPTNEAIAGIIGLYRSLFPSQPFQRSTFFGNRTGAQRRDRQIRPRLCPLEAPDGTEDQATPKLLLVWAFVADVR